MWVEVWGVCGWSCGESVWVEAYLDCARDALAHDVLLEHLVDDRVDVLVHPLEEVREAKVDADLEVLEEVGVVEGADLRVRRGV